MRNLTKPLLVGSALLFTGACATAQSVAPTTNLPMAQADTMIDPLPSERDAARQLEPRACLPCLGAPVPGFVGITRAGQRARGVPVVALRGA